MVGRRLQYLIAWMAIWLLVTPIGVCEQTWHLGKAGGWKELQPQGKDKDLLVVAEIKRLIIEGQTDAAAEALEQLKTARPELVGPDLDAFFGAEKLYGQGKLVKAVRSYDKFLDEFPESQLFEVALDRQFTIASAFLAGRKINVLGLFWVRAYGYGEKTMDRIRDRAGDAPVAVRAVYAVVQSLEKRHKFEQAYHRWSQISSLWPEGRTGRDGLLGMARCKHAAYRGPKYDASSLISAKSYYERFKQRYPEQALQLRIDEKLGQIKEQLAYKQLAIAEYYQETGSTGPANLYYQMVKENWPETTAAKMAEKE